VDEGATNTDFEGDAWIYSGIKRDTKFIGIRFKSEGSSKKYKYTEFLMVMLLVVFWQAMNHDGTGFTASSRA